MSAIKKAKADVVDEIMNVTVKQINDLTELWLSMFDDETVTSYIFKLTEHVNTFFDEIHDETADRKQIFLQKISELKDEKKRLQRLLRINQSEGGGDDGENELLNEETKRLFNYHGFLDDKLKSLREEIEHRERLSNLLISNEKSWCNLLATEPIGLSTDPLPTSGEIERFEKHLHEMEKECLRRKTKFEHLIEKIKNFAIEIEFSLTRDHNYGMIKSAESFGYLSDANFNILNQCFNNLTTYKTKLDEDIRLKKEKLTALFECLDVSPRSRKKFLELNVCTKTNSDILQAELVRCEKLKRQNIQKFVEKIRQQIEEYWDKTLKSSVERARFTNFTNDCYTEDLLTLHEMELKDLKSFYEENLLIFQKYNEHKTLWERFLALEAKEKEPGRYQNRGGQLLQEEKERRTIQSKLPKIIDAITKMTTEYEEKYNRKFLVWGRDIDELINEDYNNHRENKEKQMSARKAAVVGARAPTPRSILIGSAQRSMMTHHLHPHYTPMSMTKMNQSSAIKRMASTTNLHATSTNKKHKIDNVPLTRHAKRNILSEFNAQPKEIIKTPAVGGRGGGGNASATKQHSKATTTGSHLHNFIKPKPSTKIRVLSTLAVGSSSRRRSSSRRNSSIRKRISTSKKTSSKSKILTSDSSHTDSLISYDVFEEHISERTPCRSSVIPATATTTTAPSRTPLRKLRSPKQQKFPTPYQLKKKILGTIRNGLTAAVGGSPTKTTIKHESQSPSSSKKLTPKNFPFII